MEAEIGPVELAGVPEHQARAALQGRGKARVRLALGPGPQMPEARQRVREALLPEVAKGGQAACLWEARTRAAILYVDIGQEGDPTPFPMPPDCSSPCRSWK